MGVSLSKTFILALEQVQPALQWVSRVFPGIRLPGLEVKPLTSFQGLGKEWVEQYFYFSPYDLTAWTGKSLTFR
jgi:hypothetical protein